MELQEINDKNYKITKSINTNKGLMYHLALKTNWLYETRLLKLLIVIELRNHQTNF